MSDETDLVGLIRQAHEGRQRSGLRHKYLRMVEGKFEFFRGTDYLYARAWPELKPRDAGPPALICGDLHLENFGAFPTDSGEFRFDVNDFDEAVVAPCALDLVRCATSILLAAESWHLAPTQATGMVLAYLDAYRQMVLHDFAQPPGADDEPELGPVADLLAAVRDASVWRMIRRYCKHDADGRWRFRRKDPRLAKVKSGQCALVIEAVQAHGQGSGWEVIDVLRRFAGIGSLGLRRYQLLVHTQVGELLLLSLKESAPSVLAPLASAAQPAFVNEAERVVWAQRHLQGQATAGLAAMMCNGRGYRLRAMIPDENKSSLNRLQKVPARLREAVAVAGRLTARSQWRGSQLPGLDLAALHAWADSPALESVLAAAVRMADRIGREYDLFTSAYRAGAFAD